MKYSFSKSKLVYLFPILAFVFFTIWWAYFQTTDLNTSVGMRKLWSATYQILALYGGLLGLLIAQKWGGTKSLVGKIILVFSLGLLLQVFGQSSGALHVFHTHIDAVPYPALGDIGFFGSVIAYLWGVILLSRVSGVRNNIKTVKNKILAILLPLIIFIGSYAFFLHGYQFDWSNPIKVFLDFGYPLGQALYVSVAILAIIMSKDTLRGAMKKPILFLIIALLVQYISDYSFLYGARYGAWYAANINDYLYCLSYFIMTLAIISMGQTFETIKES